ncbi:response regulator transcription factor [bacterium]|nr:response regulator transcription factor [bacterium]
MKNLVSIVEDHEQTALELRQVLDQSTDFRFLKWYGSGEQAIKGLAIDIPDFVIMDIGLPGIDGVETIRRLRRQLPDLKIIVLTVFEDAASILSAIEAGANGYLLKDTNIALLMAELKVMQLGGAPMSPAIALKIINRLSSVNKDETETAEKKGTAFEQMLTSREREVLNHISLGYTYSGIADAFSISPHTVRRHIEKIYQKLNVHSRSEAIIKGKQVGLLDG